MVQVEPVGQDAIEAQLALPLAGQRVLLLERPAVGRGAGPQQRGEVGGDGPLVEQAQLAALGHGFVEIGDDLVAGFQVQYGHGRYCTVGEEKRNHRLRRFHRFKRFDPQITQITQI